MGRGTEVLPNLGGYHRRLLSPGPLGAADLRKSHLLGPVLKMNINDKNVYQGSNRADFYPPL